MTVDWTIAALVGLAAFTVTVGGIVWRLAQTLTQLDLTSKVMVADVKRLSADINKLELRLLGDIDRLETETDRTAVDLRHDTGSQIKELHKLFSESTVSKDHLLLQLQTLELRVLNVLLEKVIRLLVPHKGG